MNPDPPALCLCFADCSLSVLLALQTFKPTRENLKLLFKEQERTVAELEKEVNSLKTQLEEAAKIIKKMKQLVNASTMV